MFARTWAAIRADASLCSHPVPRRRISSKENTSHLYKGRHANFTGFRCFIAATPPHATGVPRAIPADTVVIPICSARSATLLTSAHRPALQQPLTSHQPLCPPPPTFTTNRPPFLRSSAVAVPPHDRHLREILSQARRSFRSPLSAHICPRDAHTTCSQAQHLQAPLARGYSRRRSIHDSQRSPAAATAARAGRRRAATASHVSNGRRHGRTRTALTRRQCRYPHARGRSFHSARQAVQSKSDRSLLILNKMNPTVANHAPAATQPTKEEKKHHRTLCPKHQHCT